MVIELAPSHCRFAPATKHSEEIFAHLQAVAHMAQLRFSSECESAQILLADFHLLIKRRWLLRHLACDTLFIFKWQSFEPGRVVLVHIGCHNTGVLVALALRCVTFFGLAVGAEFQHFEDLQRAGLV